MSSNGFKILLKFAKTLQDLDKTLIIPVLKSDRSVKSCPVLAFEYFIAQLVAGSHSFYAVMCMA